MGVVHKLKPEVRDFILEQKTNNSLISCRKLTTLILEKFQTKVSKSSINIIIKEAGLSAPVGRTPKKKRQRIAMPTLPILLEDASAESAQRLAEEAEKKAKAEAEAKAEALRLAQEEEELKKAEREAEQAAEDAAKKAEEERWAKVAEEERLAKEAQEKLQAEEEEKARKAAEEAERKAKEEAEARAKAEAEAEAEAEALRLAQEKEARKAALEAERLKQEEAKLVSVGNVFDFTQIDNTGLILLKAADSYLGGVQGIVEALKERLGRGREDLNSIVENLIFLPLFQEKIEKSVLDKLLHSLEELENVKALGLDIVRAIDFLLQEVRCIKVSLSDKSSCYLDGQMYSVWSTPHIPYDFAAPIVNLKDRVSKFINEGQPIILLNAPGYDMPSSEFFNFILALEAQTSTINSLTYYGNKLEELDLFPVNLGRQGSIIFGLWPWQFTTCRKVNKIGEFRRCRIETQNRDVHIADIDLVLTHPASGKQLSFYGCALKINPAEKTRLVILSNLPLSVKGSEELANIYLTRWPNIDEAFQDYSRKIELFTYTANSQRYFSTEKIGLKVSDSLKIRDLLNNYLVALDAYLRWCLLPSGFEDKSMQETYEMFYSLNVQLSKVNDNYIAKFIIPESYSFGKDLAYLCRRINEKKVFLRDGKGLYFNLE